MLKDSNRKLENAKRALAVGIVFLLVCIVMNLGFPYYAYADIESSVNNGTDQIYQTIRNISGGLAICIVGGGFLANMIPIIEIGQKAKMIILRALIGVVGISFTMQLVLWAQQMQ